MVAGCCWRRVAWFELYRILACIRWDRLCCGLMDMPQHVAGVLNREEISLRVVFDHIATHGLETRETSIGLGKFIRLLQTRDTNSRAGTIPAPVGALPGKPSAVI